MPLILVTLFTFVVIGLRSERFGSRQNALVAGLAIWLATVQFLFARFL